MKINLLKVDSKRAEQGDWIRDLPGLDGVSFKVRGFSNRDYQAAISNERSKAGPDKRKDGRINGDILPEAFSEMVNRCMVDHILIDWTGLEDDEENAIPYSRETAMKFLSDPDYRPLSDAIYAAAREVEQIVENRIAASEKN